MSNMDRAIKRAQNKPTKAEKLFRKNLLAGGKTNGEVDQILIDNPGIADEDVTYEATVSNYDKATVYSLQAKNMLEHIGTMDIIDGVDAVEHAELLKGTMLNVKAVLKEHTSIIDLVDDFKSKTGTVTGEDNFGLLEMASITEITHATTMQLQENIFFTLAINVGLDIKDMGGIE